MSTEDIDATQVDIEQGWVTPRIERFVGTIATVKSKPLSNGNVILYLLCRGGVRLFIQASGPKLTIPCPDYSRLNGRKVRIVKLGAYENTCYFAVHTDTNYILLKRGMGSYAREVRRYE